MTISRRWGWLSLFVCALAASGCSAGGGNRGKTRGAAGDGVGGDNGGGQSGSPGLIVLSEMCGDGKIDANEACDDHNSVLGDGCSPSCQIEAGCTCDDTKMHCSCGSCGDGVLGGAESCDDHNTTSGDGCSATCVLEDGWICHAPGKKCVPLCGDGKMISVEQCDDGNGNDGDGCSSNCLVEPGASCTGMPSQCKVAVCGNGAQEGNEGCDCGDGTAAHPVPANCPGPNGLFTGDGSGCSKTCTKEPQCRGTQPAPKYSGATHACAISCGNGNVEEGETCDDGNSADGDGCSKDCKVEAGFTCSPQAKSDLQTCVQAINAGKQCLELPVLYRDFKNESVMPGGHPDFFFHGTPVAKPITISGVAGLPGNTFNKRYCVPNTAGVAPLVNGGDTTARCWDMAQTSLDAEGKPQFNTMRNGGGDSATLCDCQFSDWSSDTNNGAVPGYSMANSPLSGFPNQDLGNGAQHPRYKGNAPIVQDATSFSQWWRNGTYESDGATAGLARVGRLELAPVPGNLYQYASPSHSLWGGFYPFDDALANGYQMYQAMGAASAGSAPGSLTVTPGAWGEKFMCNDWPYWFSAGGYGEGNNCKAKQYILPPTASATACSNPASMSWWNGCWMGATGYNADSAAVQQGWRHDSWFTTEARYLFNFGGPFSLDFYGDDDTFVFINGTLVIDLGGVHQRIPGHVDVDASGNATYTWGGAIDPTTNQITACATTTVYPFQDPKKNPAVTLTPEKDCRTGSIMLGLQMGKTYEIAIFGADRGAPESNFQLTVSGFATNESQCGPRCGDGVASGAEECDCGDGTGPLPAGCDAANSSAYGGCGMNCKWGPFCGDGMPQSPQEECDNGVKNNKAAYGTKNGCTSGCTWAHYCGDGFVDAANDEQCDAGAGNGTGLCDVTCRYKPK